MSRVAAHRVKQDAAPNPVPQSLDEVIKAIADIGRCRRERTRLESAMNDELAAVRERWERQAAPYLDRIKAQSQGVRTWCEANRDRLTQGGKVKFAKLQSGEVKWRITPPKVVIRAVEAVLAALHEAGLERLIRTKEEPNKEAISLDPGAVADIKGISITQKEEFVIIPFETDLEEIA